MILHEIVAKRKEQLAREKSKISLEEMQKLAQTVSFPTRDFAKALKQNRLSVMAEVKKASPSKGLICPEFHPAAIARTYEQAGANAVSVLTEEAYFQGCSDFLKEVRAVTNLPILRKDFIFDPYQIYEARVLGADAILLIAALLSTEQLQTFIALAKSLSMECLTEVHNRAQLSAALQADAAVIGINNRNLLTFETTLNITEELAPHIPPECTIVSESGIQTQTDMKRVRKAGADAVLIGETLMRSANPVQTLQELREDV